MSNEAISIALRQKLPATPKWVLMVLCNAANDADGRTCRRSHSLLAEETGLNRTTVVHAVQELVENGRIAKVGRHSDGSIIYRVLVADDNQPWTVKPGESCPTQPVKRQLPTTTRVALDNQESCPTQPRKLSTATHNQRNQRTKEKNTTDPRHQPFVAWLMENHYKMAIAQPDYRALKDLLAATRNNAAYTLEKLQAYWALFINSPDQFDRDKGLSLGYFCRNINKFVRRHGTHSENGGSTQSATPGSTSSQRTATGDPKYVPKQR